MYYLIPYKGPHPATVVCDDEDIIHYCNTFQYEDWLSDCNDKVDKGFKETLIRACVIDLCETNTQETKHEVVSIYVSECKKDEDKDFLCDWETNFFGKEPICEENEEYKGLEPVKYIIKIRRNQNEKTLHKN